MKKNVFFLQKNYDIFEGRKLLPRRFRTVKMERAFGINELEARIDDELRFIRYHPENWKKRESEDAGVYQVVVIGGGMGGMAVAFALLKIGIFDIQIVDQQPAGKEGPWATYARMKTL